MIIVLGGNPGLFPFWKDPVFFIAAPPHPCHQGKRAKKEITLDESADHSVRQGLFLLRLII